MFYGYTNFNGYTKGGAWHGVVSNVKQVESGVTVFLIKFKSYSFATVIDSPTQQQVFSLAY